MVMITDASLVGVAATWVAVAVSALLQKMVAVAVAIDTMEFDVAVDIAVAHRNLLQLQYSQQRPWSSSVYSGRFEL